MIHRKRHRWFTSRSTAVLAGAIALGLGAVPAAAEPDLPSYAVAADGTVARVESGNHYVLVLGKGEGERRLPLPDIDAVHDEDPRPVVSWSSDARHLAVQYKVAGPRGRVAVFDAESLGQLRVVEAFDFAWTERPGELVFIPSYDAETGPTYAGMGRMDVVGGNTEPLGSGTYFTGPVRVRGPWVVARTAPLEQDRTRYCLATVHLDTGETAEIACED